ncbi:MAG: phage tail protein [Methanosarcinales archaeon]|nr:phage tail protein [Methanosarcinales archaeon]
MEDGAGLKEKRIGGIVLGIVTNNQDKEGLGRVKVKFPWLDDGDESRWARVATLMAGNARGCFFLPEVGDEVVIAFDHGDINHPYVLGSLWSGADMPPDGNRDGKNNLRIIKSRSGHTITFNDQDNRGNVEICSGSGHRILLDDSKGGEKIEIVDKTGENSILIDSVRNAITISCQTKLSIKARTFELESSGPMNIKSGAILTIEGALVKIN